MTISEQLAVLEKVARVIDPESELVYHALSYPEKAPWNWLHIVEDRKTWVHGFTALALREKQAWAWIEKWCRENEAWYVLDYSPVGGYTLQVGLIDILDGPGLLWEVKANSLAELFKAAIAELTERKEQDDG